MLVVRKKEETMSNKNEWRVMGTTTDGEKLSVVKKAWYGHSAIDFVAKDLGIRWKAVCAIRESEYQAKVTK
jgi:hypothetical protein